MIIPSFLKDGDVVGVTACSTGVLEKLDKFLKSVEVFNEKNLRIKETDNVRTGGAVSSSGEVRARELESLFVDDEVKLVAVARGGDFLSDMLNYVNFDILKEHPKWLVGSSDPTSLMHILTTKYDIATMYTPCNMTGFDVRPLHESYNTYFEIIKGNLVKQCKYDKYEGEAFSDVMDAKNEWININGDVLEEGRLIGGCIEVLKDIIGTKFDYTKEFIDRYKDEGIIWYFDVFAMSAEDLYNTLIQFRNASWFNNTKAILIGKVAFPKNFSGLSYEELISKALPDIKVIYLFDVGHVKPSFTMINGAKVRVISNDKEGSLEYIK